MKKLLAFLIIIFVINSCSESDSPIDEESQEIQIYDAPAVRSYVTFISQNSVTLNGFINHSNIYFPESDAFKVGFTFRAGNENDSSNDQVIELEGNVDYYTGLYIFNHTINGLEPSTTYYYTANTKNGSSEKDDWESFTTSDIPCSYTRDNYYSISGDWKTANVEISDPQCCDDGNVGFKFGNWPNIYEINFNELESRYPNTGQYFGVNYEFDISHIQRELVKSTNQVLIGSRSTPETELFVENDGETITLIFCNTVLRDGTILNGKVSVEIPEN